MSKLGAKGKGKASKGKAGGPKMTQAMINQAKEMRDAKVRRYRQPIEHSNMPALSFCCIPCTPSLQSAFQWKSGEGMPAHYHHWERWLRFFSGGEGQG